MKTVSDILRQQRCKLEEGKAESPALSAELLLAHALGLSRQELLHRLIVAPQTPCPADCLLKFDGFCERRLRGEPVAYIIGSKEFYGRDFLVTPATLIPRPETELIVDLALKHFPANSCGRFADLGGGSGCLAVTLALELPAWQGLAVDISTPALAVAAANAERLGAGGRVSFLEQDLTVDFLEPDSLDLLVSNPPYVSEADFRALEPGVREYEPKSALVPSVGAEEDLVRTTPDGRELLPVVCAKAGRALKPGGLLLMEIGFDQGDYMRELLHHDATWSEALVIKDLAGLDRTVFARKRG